MKLQGKHGCLSSTNRAIVVFIMIALGLLLIQACTLSSKAMQVSQQEAAASTNVGDIAPDFTLFDLDGNEVRLSEFRGKVVFLNFWATWCPPCRAEMPDMESLYQEYKDKGLLVVGIDIGEPETTVRQFVQQGGYSWTFVIDNTGAVAANYNIRAIPTSFFIDREGVIQATNIGSMNRHAMKAMLAPVIMTMPS